MLSPKILYANCVERLRRPWDLHSLSVLSERINCPTLFTIYHFSKISFLFMNFSFILFFVLSLFHLSLVFVFVFRSFSTRSRSHYAFPLLYPLEGWTNLATGTIASCMIMQYIAWFMLAPAQEGVVRGWESPFAKISIYTYSYAQLSFFMISFIFCNSLAHCALRPTLRLPIPFATNINFNKFDAHSPNYGSWARWV